MNATGCHIIIDEGPIALRTSFFKEFAIFMNAMIIQ